MDKKLTFPGGEPNISNADILYMQYSNREGIHALSNVFGEDCVLTGCVLSLTGTYPNKVLHITEGYVSIAGKVVKVEAQSVSFVVSNNVPVGDQAAYNVVILPAISYNTLGDKTYNDGTARRTFEETRGIMSVRDSYPDPIPTGSFKIASLYATIHTSTINITTLYGYDPIRDEIVDYWVTKVDTISKNSTFLASDSAGKIVSSTLGVGSTSDKIPQCGSTLSEWGFVTADSNGKLVTTADGVYTHKYNLPGINTSGGSWSTTVSALGLPAGATILKIDVAIVDDTQFVTLFNPAYDSDEESVMTMYNTGAVNINFNSFIRTQSGTIKYTSTAASRGWLLITYTV